MMPTPRLGDPLESTSQAVCYSVYLPPPGMVPKRLSKGLRTSCSPIISARVCAPKRASSSSCLSQEAQVSGLAVAKVRYCCCRAPAPQTNGAECSFFAGAPPRGVTPTGGALDCEFRGFESEVMGKPVPYHRPRTVLSMPVARPFQNSQKMSPETPIEMA